MSNSSPQQECSQAQNFILFAQHGWADTYHDINYLAQALVDQSSRSNIPIYTPDLGWINTWLTITPLIDKVERIAIEAIAQYPDLPLRIVGHSMGGLIWLEVLNRHQEWWHKVHSLVLVASPVGGSDLGRLFDPLRLFPLIARDLGTNRRPIAEAIASQIPTLSIVGNVGNHTDGTVPIGCSQFNYASLVYLDGLRHPTLKNHPRVAEAIRQFWNRPVIAPLPTDSASQLITKLRAIDLTETNNQSFQYAQVIKTYPDDTKLWVWKNYLQVTHIFVSDSIAEDQGSIDRCIYTAFTGWKDQDKLVIALKNL
ncbi:alpha/beta hydrolase [Pseudanabaena yagii]|uniref:Lysophospholipase n=1 Tax=Pseudanabaena yagii GIHE-NHR1 TaxID=2722753 RepID=A0ABX1LR58_9CYAN|nr:alpha/beta hydrolase [Pseudanabaena yagii]NMF57521.1 lysophospholipase [Pseudanabaena yagii GIHE-NHR1]